MSEKMQNAAIMERQTDHGMSVEQRIRRKQGLFHCKSSLYRHPVEFKQLYDCICERFMCIKDRRQTVSGERA